LNVMNTANYLSGAGMLTLMAAALAARAQPIITQQPASHEVSLGANVAFLVSATTTHPPLTYQWRRWDAEIPAATNKSLTLTNVAWSDMGAYRVAVSDAGGTTLSEPGQLGVDLAFTKVMTSALVAEKGHWHIAAWGDYDNDGYPDLFIHKCGPSTSELLFHNNRDGTFTRLTLPLYIIAEGGWGSAWGDYDNDGYLDLFVPHGDGQNVLFHNKTNGEFERIAAGPGAGHYVSTSGVWGDYDRDGWLDLFVVNSGGGMSAGVNQLWCNQGDGTFVNGGQGVGKVSHGYPVVSLAFIELHPQAAAVGCHLQSRLQSLAPESLASGDHVFDHAPLAQDPLGVGLDARGRLFEPLGIAGQSVMLDQGPSDGTWAKSVDTVHMTAHPGRPHGVSQAAVSFREKAVGPVWQRPIMMAGMITGL
jgi:hypothetical protein